jgi:hypothetical protein
MAWVSTKLKSHSTTTTASGILRATPPLPLLCLLARLEKQKMSNTAPAASDGGHVTKMKRE